MQIILYAPFGTGLPPEKIGGAETGCQKTLAIYRKAGIKVTCVEKIARTGRILPYILKTAGRLSRLFYTCITHPRAMVHVVGFYDKVLRIEWFIVKMAKALGCTVVYEMRNGNLVECYRNRDKSYRETQRDIWNSARGLICQGAKYVDLIKEETGKDSFLYPNFICDSFLENELPYDRPYDKELTLITFGRLVPDKNIDVVIRAAALVKKRYPQTKLHLIGGASGEYRRYLNKVIRKVGLKDNDVVFHGHHDFKYIAPWLAKSHFYLFPTSNPNEGHSNSLTEAMGLGVVPVASAAGFNRTVIGDGSLVISSLDPKAYADAIVGILERGEWKEKSAAMRQRVASKFTESIVSKRLIEYLKSL